jgi:addiction module RelE/StbE family toxin
MIRKYKDTPDITFLDPFDKQLKNAPDEIQEAFADTLELFLEDPHHPQLRNHELREKFAGLRSIDVTGDWRAVFKENQPGKQKIIKFYVIGTHKELYG